MKLNFPNIRIGTPLLARDIPVFPLYLSSEPTLDYILGAEAKRTGVLSVEAVGQDGDFLTGNNGDRPILLLWRETLEYCHARLGTSLLIAPKTSVTVPPWLVQPYQPFAREGSHRTHAVGAVVVDTYFLLNLFDQETTCRRAWRRLLHTPHCWSEPQIRHSIQDIRRFWNQACEVDWQPMETIGAGHAWRASGEDLKAWALTFGDALIHLQIAAPCWAEKRKEVSRGAGRIPKRRGQPDKRQLWLPFTDQ